MTQLFTRPITIDIDRPELTRRRLGASVKRAWKQAAGDYEREMEVIIEQNVPVDTGNLITSLQASVSQSRVNVTPEAITLVLYLSTFVEYASYVNEARNWSHPPRVDYYWDWLKDDVCPDVARNAATAALRAEGLS